MNQPENHSKDTGTQVTDADIDALMENLPAAYADWERRIGSAEMVRILERISVLMKQERSDQSESVA